jgi:hypothetical protein
MESLSTPVVEREEKRAGELKPGDWLADWHVEKVLSAHHYTLRGREKVLIVSRDPTYNQPEVLRLDADFRLILATPDEIPEDAFGSGREVDADVDLSVGIPAFVEGHFQTGRAK